MKKKGGKWRKISWPCKPGMIGAEQIPVLLVFKANRVNDTLFLSEDLRYVFDPKKGRSRMDEKSEIKKLLFADAKMRPLFEPDLRRLYSESIARYKPDSVSFANIGIPLYDLHLNDRLRLSRDFGWEFSVEENKVSAAKIDLEKAKGRISEEVFGIKLADPESKVVSLFPSSTKDIGTIRTYFPNSDGSYTVGVRISENRGWCDFVLKDAKVVAIALEFLYPN
ncbi:hypothetical protein [Flavobacterium sp.]|uniref:hypothetical protein n=1 Tax=Flavobacterium sp. TaxID=239 RepID=UPI0012291734|nr:hypothetical protein [Flavobacterium sp.]RZJ72918.1 MAG: hypothetical protein EOO49_04610 [Flavobacterium sp.]